MRLLENFNIYGIAFLFAVIHHQVSIWRNCENYLAVYKIGKGKKNIQCLAVFGKSVMPTHQYLEMTYFSILSLVQFFFRSVDICEPVMAIYLSIAYFVCKPSLCCWPSLNPSLHHKKVFDLSESHHYIIVISYICFRRKLVIYQWHRI